MERNDDQLPDQDPFMAAMQAGVSTADSGDREAGRAMLVKLWSSIDPGGGPFYRCTLAHYLADVVEHPAEALMWDVRALDAADEISEGRDSAIVPGLDIAGFYPSLHLNIADNLRQLSAFDAAERHIGLAKETSPALGNDDYCNWIRESISEVAADIDNKVTERRSTAP